LGQTKGVWGYEMNAKSSHAAEILIQGPPAFLLAINKIPTMAKIPFHHLPVANSLLLASFAQPYLPISRLALTLTLALALWLCFHFNARHRIPTVTVPSRVAVEKFKSVEPETEIAGH